MKLNEIEQMAAEAVNIAVVHFTKDAYADLYVFYHPAPPRMVVLPASALSSAERKPNMALITASTIPNRERAFLHTWLVRRFQLWLLDNQRNKL